MQQTYFPSVSRENLVLSCFNCYQDHVNPYFFESENANGRGKYFTTCECCGMRTFFDFLEDTNAKLSQNA